MTIPPKQSDREIVLAWLARINETDPAQIAFVIGECAKRQEARKYYVACAGAQNDTSGVYSNRVEAE